MENKLGTCEWCRSRPASTERYLRKYFKIQVCRECAKSIDRQIEKPLVTGFERGETITV